MAPMATPSQRPGGGLRVGAELLFGEASLATELPKRSGAAAQKLLWVPPSTQSCLTAEAVADATTLFLTSRTGAVL